MALPIPQPEIDSRIRKCEHAGKLYYSMVDVMALYYDDTGNSRQRWADAKRRLKREMGELYEDFLQLRMASPDGKQRLTDIGTRRDIMRVFMTEQSERSEPFRQWLLDTAEEKLRTIEWDASEVRAKMIEAGLEDVPNSELAWWQR